MREQRPAVAVMRANQPEREFWIMRMREIRMEHGKTDRERLMSPIVRQARASPSTGRQTHYTGFGERLSPIWPVGIAACQKSLKPWIGLAGVMQIRGQGDIGELVGVQPGSIGETFRPSPNILAMIDQGHRLIGDNTQF